MLRQVDCVRERFVLTGGFVLDSGQLGRWSIGVLECSIVAVMRLV
jgi:hypothetical protein